MLPGICSFVGFVVASGCVTVRSVEPGDLARLDESPRQQERSQSGNEADAAKAKQTPEAVANGSARPGPTTSTNGASAAPTATKYPKYLRDLEGEPVELKPGVRLYVRLLDGHEIGGDVTNTEVRNGQFLWKPAEGESQIKVPLSEIKSAEVHSTDVGKTLALAGGLTVGAMLVLLILYLNALAHAD